MPIYTDLKTTVRGTLSLSFAGPPYLLTLPFCRASLSLSDNGLHSLLISNQTEIYTRELTIDSIWFSSQTQNVSSTLEQNWNIFLGLDILCLPTTLWFDINTMFFPASCLWYKVFIPLGTAMVCFGGWSMGSEKNPMGFFSQFDFLLGGDPSLSLHCPCKI